MTRSALPSVARMPVRVGVRLVALAHLDAAEVARDHMLQGRDDEALHDFRVALRRLRSWLRAFRPWFDGAVGKADRQRLREIARATGDARDIEVQLEHLGGPAIPDSLRVAAAGLAGELTGLERKADRSALRAVHHFPDAASRLRDSLPVYQGRVDPDSTGRVETTAVVASTQAGALLGELRGRLSAVHTVEDGPAVHDARIGAKRIRYVLEPFRDDAPAVREAVSQLRDFQDAFGEHHDVEVLLGLVIARRDRLSGDDVAERDGLDDLVSHLVEARDRSFTDVVQPWTQGEKATPFLATLENAIAALGEFDAGSPLEVERKFLLSGMPRRRKGRSVLRIDQGWLPGEKVVERIRRVRGPDGTRWVRTVKIGHGMVRSEIEEEIDAHLFGKLWPLTRGRRVSKTRYVFPDDGHVWEVDRFIGFDLVIAEVELESAAEKLTPPSWLERYVVREVTGDRRYENASLAIRNADSASSRPDQHAQ